MLVDSFGRTIRYLRVSVTDRCNLFCTYCRLPTEEVFSKNRELLDFDEIVRLVRLFLTLGVECIRLTGGEPLMRRNIIELVRALANLPGLKELALSSNALLLGRYAVPLREAGLHRVNISLDSLDPKTFSNLTQRKKSGQQDKTQQEAHATSFPDAPKKETHLSSVLTGIKAATQAGLHPVKVNMVVMRGINEHEIPNMVTFAQEHGVVLRFIETMPVGGAGLNVSGHFMPAEDILDVIRNHFGTQLLPVQHAAGNSGAMAQGSGPARYFLVSKTGAEVGIISARSQHFCSTCNRMRLTSKGSNGIYPSAIH